MPVSQARGASHPPPPALRRSMIPTPVLALVEKWVSALKMKRMGGEEKKIGLRVNLELIKYHKGKN